MFRQQSGFLRLRQDPMLILLCKNFNDQNSNGRYILVSYRVSHKLTHLISPFLDFHLFVFIGWNMRCVVELFFQLTKSCMKKSKYIFCFKHERNYFLFLREPLKFLKEDENICYLKKGNNIDFTLQKRTVILPKKDNSSITLLYVMN